MQYAFEAVLHFAFILGIRKSLNILFISVQDPIRIITELHTDKLCEHRRYFLVSVGAGTAVACKDIKIVFRDSDALGKLTR